MHFDMPPTAETREIPNEEAVVLLKPGAAEFEERLLMFFEKRGINVQNRKEIDFDEETLRRFYPHAAEVYIPGMVEHFSHEKVVAFHISGPDAVRTCMRLKGHLRGLFHLRPPGDMIHASDSPEEAGREKEALGL